MNNVIEKKKALKYTDIQKEDALMLEVLKRLLCENESHDTTKVISIAKVRKNSALLEKTNTVLRFVFNLIKQIVKNFSFFFELEYGWFFSPASKCGKEYRYKEINK